MSVGSISSARFAYLNAKTAPTSVAAARVQKAPADIFSSERTSVIRGGVIKQPIKVGQSIKLEQSIKVEQPIKVSQNPLPAPVQVTVPASSQPILVTPADVTYAAPIKTPLATTSPVGNGDNADDTIQISPINFYNPIQPIKEVDYGNGDIPITVTKLSMATDPAGYKAMMEKILSNPGLMQAYANAGVSDPRTIEVFTIVTPTNPGPVKLLTGILQPTGNLPPLPEGFGNFGNSGTTPITLTYLGATTNPLPGDGPTTSPVRDISGTDLPGAGAPLTLDAEGTISHAPIIPTKIIPEKGPIASPVYEFTGGASGLTGAQKVAGTTEPVIATTEPVGTSEFPWMTALPPHTGGIKAPPGQEPVPLPPKDIRHTLPIIDAALPTYESARPAPLPPAGIEIYGARGYQPPISLYPVDEVA